MNSVIKEAHTQPLISQQRFFLKTFAFLSLIILQLFDISYASKPEYKRELFYEIRLGKDSHFGYNNEIENKYRGLHCPYNIVADTKGNIWIVDPVKKRCIIIAKDKHIKTYSQGTEFEKIDKKMVFEIIAIDDTRLLLPHGIIDRKTKKTLARSSPYYYRDHIVVSAGFTKDGGYYFNTAPVNAPSVIFSNTGKTLIIGAPYYCNRQKKKTYMCTYFFSPLSKKSYSKKVKDSKFYFIINPNTPELDPKQLNLLNFIRFVDREGNIYSSDGYFKCPCPAVTSILMIYNPETRYSKKLTFHRIWPNSKPNSGELPFVANRNETAPIMNQGLESEKTYRLGLCEDVIGFTYEGDIFYTQYIPYDSIKIFKLTPTVRK